MKKVLTSIFAILSVLSLSACKDTDASVVSENLSKSADMFEINRRVVFYNGITNDYILSVEGLCALDSSVSRKLTVTCKVGNGVYKKHFLGLSDNVTYFAEQLEPVKASAYYYKVIFKPQVILPDIQLSVGR